MSSLSTFGTFTMARLGIWASQQALNVTGNNISNVNTEGYSRQEINLYNVSATGADRYQSKFDIRVSGGAVVDDINQMRDKYLDIRYRDEMASVGAMDAKADGLNQLATIFDEVGRGEDGEGLLEARLEYMIQQVETLSAQGAGMDEFDSMLRESASTFVELMRNRADELNRLADNMEKGFRQDLDTVNSLLSRIQELNVSIRKSQVYGSQALTQQDERNKLIDELSEYMKIDVQYISENLGENVYVDKLIIRTGGVPQRTLVDGIYAAQFSVREGSDNFDLDLSALKDAYGRTNPQRTNLGAVAGGFADEAAAEAALADTAAYPVTGKDDDRDSSTYGSLYEYEYSVVEVPGENEGDPSTYAIHKIQVSRGAAELTDTELYGALQSEREILTEKGVYATSQDLANDTNASTKRGIPFYQKALDTLANTFADLLNRANMLDDTQGKNPDGSPIYRDESTRLYEYETLSDLGDGYTETDGIVYLNGVATGQTVDSAGFVLDAKGYRTVKVDHEGYYALSDYANEHGYNGGGALFSNDGRGNDLTGITAANISISASWANGSFRVLSSTKPDAASRENDNLNRILNILTEQHEYTPVMDGLNTGDDTPDSTLIYFTGSFQELLTTHMTGTLATDINTAQTMLDNYNVTADELYVNRDAVMGVDLNDEAVNMMMYQKSYAAACRLMTMYDEMLDKLINGT